MGRNKSICVTRCLGISPSWPLPEDFTVRATVKSIYVHQRWKKIMDQLLSVSSSVVVENRLPKGQQNIGEKFQYFGSIFNCQ